MRFSSHSESHARISCSFNKRTECLQHLPRARVFPTILLPSAKPFARDVSPPIRQISEAAQNITLPYYLHIH